MYSDEYPIGVQVRNVYGLTNKDDMYKPVMKEDKVIGYIEYIDKDWVYLTISDYKYISEPHLVINSSFEFKIV